MLQVRYFGTSRAIELFFAAQSVVYLITSLSQSGQLAEVFLPEYIKLKEKNHKFAHEAYSVLVNRIAVYTTLLLIAAFLMAPYIMDVFVPGFSEEDKNLATLLFRTLLPLIFVTIQNSFLNTVLNAERVFGRSEAAGLINSGIALTFLVLLYDKMGVWVLVLAVYVGMLVQILLSLYFAQKKQIKYYWIWKANDFKHNVFFRTIYATVRYTGATQCLNWAFTASLSFLPQGIYAIFTYVYKLYPKINSIFTTPISVVFFTRIASKVSINVDDNILRKEMNIVQGIALLFGSLVFTLTLGSGKEGLSFLWFGNKFGKADLDIAYLILVALFSVYTLQVFYAINRKFCVALGHARKSYNYQAVTQFISAVIVYLLIIEYELNGLIIGIVINRLMLMVVPAFINWKKEKDRWELPSKGFLIRLLLVVVVVVGFVLISKNNINYIMGEDKLTDLFYTIAWACVVSIVFLMASLVFLREDLKKIRYTFSAVKK